MGGIGSGRNRERAIVETCFKFSVEAFADTEGLLAGRRGTMTWGAPSSPELEFAIHEDRIEILAPFQVTISTVERQTPTGGTYLLFVCPGCGQAVRDLYLRPQSHDTVGCRDDWNLTYRRNNVSGSPRRLAAWRIDKLKEELADLKKAARADSARYAPERQARVAEIEEGLRVQERIRREHMWMVVDKLLEDVREMGYEPYPPSESSGLRTPLLEASDDEIRDIGQHLCKKRWPRVL